MATITNLNSGIEIVYGGATTYIKHGNVKLLKRGDNLNIYDDSDESGNQRGQVYMSIPHSEVTSPVTADIDELYDSVRGYVDVSSGGSSGQNGFIDYNDTTGAFSINADTWTDLPNDGLGAFTNKNYPPTGVTELMDTSTGYLDVSELTLGDNILIRNDYTINPNTNNAQLKFRYELGSGGGTYTLEKIIGRLDSGSGQDYRFSLTPDLIYMGDTNTRDNPIKLQVYCTSNATVTNAGTVITVVKR